VRAAVIAIALAACGTAPAIPDTGDDFVPPPADAIGSHCDPIAQALCGADEKCGWTRLVATPADQLGLIACAPDGTVPLGGACTFGASGMTTGYDDCARGLACLAPIDQEQTTGTCETICDVLAAPGTAEGCAAGFTCVRHTGYFANASDPMTEAGLCDPS
jgi:hypothetical protein